jgi:hypothetical protein
MMQTHYFVIIRLLFKIQINNSTFLAITMSAIYKVKLINLSLQKIYRMEIN